MLECIYKIKMKTKRDLRKQLKSNKCSLDTEVAVTELFDGHTIGYKDKVEIGSLTLGKHSNMLSKTESLESAQYLRYLKMVSSMWTTELCACNSYLKSEYLQLKCHLADKLETLSSEQVKQKSSTSNTSELVVF